MSDKRCTRCKQSKNRSEFSAAKLSKDGLSHYCKPCRAEMAALSRRAQGVLPKPVPAVANESGKECLRCGEVKPLEVFPVSPRGRLGRGSYCVPCSAAYHTSIRELPGGRAKSAAYTRKYRAENQERWRLLHRVDMRNRRDRKSRVDSGLVTAKVVRGLYARDVCQYCRRLVPLDQRTIDHVVPLARGGIHHPDNLVMACGTCNFSKKDKTCDEWTPRRDSSNDPCGQRELGERRQDYVDAPAVSPLHSS